MNQKTLIALGAMVVLGILAVLTLQSPQKGDRVGPRERPIAAFKAADIKELELASNGGKDKVTLKRDGASWKLTAPSENAADQGSVKTAVDQLEKLAFGDIVTEKKEKYGDLEVSDDKGAHVIARGDGGKVLFDAWLGKSVSGFTMVRPSGKEQVWQATGLFKYTYAKEAKAWRDHSMFSLTAAEVTKLQVESGGQKIVLEKLPAPEDKDRAAAAPPPEAKWKVVEASVKVDPLDDSVANGVISSLSSLSAADFDDSKDYAAAGLAPQPRFKISVTTKGVPAALLIGKIAGDDVWAQIEGKPQIYLLRKYSVERLAMKPVDFRDKTLVNAKEDDITSLEVMTGGATLVLDHDKSEWKLGKGLKGTLDDTKVHPLVTSFDNFKGSSFAETTNPADNGLAKPESTVTLHLRDKRTVVLKVGKPNADSSEYYVQVAGSPDVLMAKKYSVDRMLKKLADVTKSDAPAK